MRYLKVTMTFSTLFSISYFFTTYLLAQSSGILCLISWYTSTDLSSFEHFMLFLCPAVLWLPAFLGMRYHNARSDTSSSSVFLALPIFYVIYGLGDAVLQKCTNQIESYLTFPVEMCVDIINNVYRKSLAEGQGPYYLFQLNGWQEHLCALLGYSVIIAFAFWMAKVFTMEDKRP